MRRDVVAAVLAFIALVAVSLFTARKPEAPAYATRASTDTNFGGYGAWYDLLEREGVRVERFHQHHDALPASGVDTLIAAFPSPALGVTWNAAERDALRQWVRAGGRLIDVGVSPSTGKNDGKGDAVHGAEPSGDGGRLAGPWSALVANLPVREKLRIVAVPHRGVETLLADRSGIVVSLHREGRGEILSIAWASAFENRALGRGDAARLAYLLGRPRGAGGVVAFDEALRGDVAEKAWYLALDVPERVALVFVALAGLLWVAYGLLPLGPPVALRPPREPTSAEFLDAVAALYGRARTRDHARDALLADARRNLEHAARTPATAALAAQVASAATITIADDAQLVAVAALARSIREETIRAGRNRTATARRTTQKGIGAGRRRW